MDTEGGGTDGGEFGEETELNILQGFDFDQNQDATWLLTSPTNSPRAGVAETFTIAPLSEPELGDERQGLVNRLDSILKRKQCSVDLMNSPASNTPFLFPPQSLTSVELSQGSLPTMRPSYHPHFAPKLSPASGLLGCIVTGTDSVPGSIEKDRRTSFIKMESSVPAASLMSPPPQISPPRLASTPSCKVRLLPIKGNNKSSQDFKLSPVMMNLEEVDIDLTPLSFDGEPALDATKDIEKGEMLSLTKPFIQPENGLGSLLTDLNRTKDMPEPPSVPTRDFEVPQNSTNILSAVLSPGDAMANLTRNLDVDCTKDLDMNRTKDLDMNRTKDLDMNRTKDLEMNRTKDLEMNRTKNLEMNCTKNLDINLTRDLYVNLTKDLYMKGTNNPDLNAANNRGLNLTQDHEGNGRVNITQHLELNSSNSIDSPAIDFHHLPNLNSTQTLESDQNVQKQPEQMATFSIERHQNLDGQILSLGVTERFNEISCNSDPQSCGISLQDQKEEYSAQAPFKGAMSTQIVRQLGMSNTQTLNTTEPEGHIKSTPEEARKDGLGKTYYSANIIRETTNKVVQNGVKQVQSRTLVLPVVRRKPDALRGVDKNPVKLNLKSGLRLQQSDQEHSKKLHGEDENSCPFKQPAMPKIGRVGNNMVRQRSLGSLNRSNNMATLKQNNPSSEYLLASKTMPGIENKMKTLRRQTSAGCGVRVLASPQLLPSVHPRVIPPTLPLEASAPSSRLRPFSRIPSNAGSKLRLPGAGRSVSRLPLLGQKPR